MRATTRQRFNDLTGRRSGEESKGRVARSLELLRTLVVTDNHRSESNVIDHYFMVVGVAARTVTASGYTSPHRRTGLRHSLLVEVSINHRAGNSVQRQW
jgi:hypothetical protein